MFMWPFSSMNDCSTSPDRTADSSETWPYVGRAMLTRARLLALSQQHLGAEARLGHAESLDQRQGVWAQLLEQIVDQRGDGLGPRVRNAVVTHEPGQIALDLGQRVQRAHIAQQILCLGALAASDACGERLQHDALDVH